MKKITALLCLCLSLVFMSGCFDRVDIEARGYVLAIAIDEYPPIPQGQQQSDKETPPDEESHFIETQIRTGEPLYAMTVQFPIIKKGSAISKGESSGADGEGSRSWEITQVGNSFMEMNREISSRTNLIPYYGQLQAIVISRAVAEKGLEDILDFFIRDPEMRLRTKLFITNEEAKKVLDVIPRIDDYSSLYIAKIPTNASINAKIIHKTDLGEAWSSLITGDDFILPRIEATKDEVRVSGAAIFKEGKMVGWLNGIEMESAKFILNLYLGGIMTANDPEHENGIVTLEIIKAKSKIIPEIKNGTLSFKIKIDVIGTYAENLISGTFIKTSDEYMQKLEKAFAENIEKICTNTIKKVQEDFGADVFFLGKALKTKKPEYWEKVKDNWHEIFRNVDVEVKAKVSIRHTGNII